MSNKCAMDVPVDRDRSAERRVSRFEFRIARLRRWSAPASFPAWREPALPNQASAHAAGCAANRDAPRRAMRDPFPPSPQSRQTSRAASATESQIHRAIRDERASHPYCPPRPAIRGRACDPRSQRNSRRRAPGPRHAESRREKFRRDPPVRLQTRSCFRECRIRWLFASRCRKHTIG